MSTVISPYKNIRRLILCNYAKKVIVSFEEIQTLIDLSSMKRVKRLNIKWIPGLKSNQILLPRQVDSPSSTVLHFGAWKKKMQVGFSENQPQDSIGLSVALKNEVTMPDTLPYEMYTAEKGLHLGPVIALLVSVKGLTPELLNEYRCYFTNYQSIKGLIYLCSVNGINPRNKTVEGYYYNPKAEGDNAPWTKGTFPYPGVVYRRIRINKSSLYDDLNVHTNRKIFNPYYLNKWELWETTRSSPLIRGHMPLTKLLDNMQTLNKMLALYGSVYLKPVNGSMGQGIMKLEKTLGGYLFMSRDTGMSFADNAVKAWAALRRMQKGKNYLIQQSVALKYQNKNVDFRVIMQKDGSQQWTCSGVIARFGEDGKFYTNDVSSISLGREALRTVLQLNDEETARKEEEIIKICTSACQLIDHKYGTFGDVGIDVTVDSDLKVWILEINSRHHHTMPSYLKEDPQMYNRVLARPFEFAKAWAGFTAENS
ncbi:YheC/YheD family protein [Paenibacillus sp. N4]|uniref:YheC/YheD family endospore coat-associated protein n=1 Tax=Paenibacillus vietnamensis TaxID=2590547 RepID=UPI001CD117FD|nr:YheC/YheD family protein [Paenibacillus vietnamensis]MCA0755426.1 YheC/YheD family protein [Paenibacillus vietnamensis]